MKKLKLLLLATLMIAGLAQAEPTQVVRGAVQEAVMHQCQDVGIFADYVALKRLMGATIQDEMPCSISAPFNTCTIIRKCMHR
jgi:hypothetical protein